MNDTAANSYICVLASGSPRRRELLARTGIPFQITTPDGVDEGSFSGTADALCVDLAVAKAEWVRDRTGTTLPVIGCDTVVALGDGASEEVLGKPRDGAHAVAMLRSLSGRTHRVLSGVSVARSGETTRSALEVSEVVFRDLGDAEIASYVASGDPYGKAGSYGIQSGGRELVAGFRGCFVNIVGLPMSTLHGLFDDPPFEWVCDCDRHPLQLGGWRCGERR